MQYYLLKNLHYSKNRIFDYNAVVKPSPMGESLPTASGNISPVGENVPQCENILSPIGETLSTHENTVSPGGENVNLVVGFTSPVGDVTFINFFLKLTLLVELKSILTLKF